MRFFEHQARARRRTFWLMVWMLVATAVVVVAVDAVVAFASYLLTDKPQAGFDRWWPAQTGLLVSASVITLLLIGGGSLYKMVALSGGGADVARSVGAVPVGSDTTDPARKRLVNVVEEMAIAAGIPVPAIFVMEGEPGINAFAAGYSPSDAAIAVTQGTLDVLNRDELQGVIAHEFSHIFNGDMRLNLRLTGLLHGILLIALVGRGMMRVSSRGDGKGAAFLVSTGFAMFVVGFIGVLCARIIKAAVSRSREFLADASAVQFTRNPSGIGGALKKIAAGDGSVLARTEAEEVSHMLFATGISYTSLMATHPPIEDRIRAIEPRFDPRELDELRQKMARRWAATEDVIRRAGGETPEGAAGLAGGAVAVTPETVSAGVGALQNAHLLDATALLAAIPKPLTAAARNPQQATLLVMATLLSAEPSAHALQLARVSELYGAEAAEQTHVLSESLAALGPGARLPLLELAFPAIRRRPREELRAFLALTKAVRDEEGSEAAKGPSLVRGPRLDPIGDEVFEYVLTRLMRQMLAEALSPRTAGKPGRDPIKGRLADLAVLFAVVAHFGHADGKQARAAYTEGLRSLAALDWAPYQVPAGWAASLDAALRRLDRLEPTLKPAVIEALVRTVWHDGQVTVREAELLRAVCAQLHCPLPPLGQSKEARA